MRDARGDGETLPRERQLLEGPRSDPQTSDLVDGHSTPDARHVHWEKERDITIGLRRITSLDVSIGDDDDKCAWSDHARDTKRGGERIELARERGQRRPSPSDRVPSGPEGC